MQAITDTFKKTLKKMMGFSVDYTKKVAHEAKYHFGWISEKVKDEQVEMTFAVTCYNYTSRWLLMMFNDIDIIYPNELKTNMQEHIHKLSSKYKA